MAQSMAYANSAGLDRGDANTRIEPARSSCESIGPPDTPPMRELIRAPSTGVVPAVPGYVPAALWPRNLRNTASMARNGRSTGRVRPHDGVKPLDAVPMVTARPSPQGVRAFFLPTARAISSRARAFSRPTFPDPGRHRLQPRHDREACQAGQAGRLRGSYRQDRPASIVDQNPQSVGSCAFACFA
jgi:hypothetical protein